MDGLMHLLIEYRYWILFPLACFEGPIIGFIAGVLIAAGYFNPIIVFGILLMGDVIPDVSYYLIGRFGNRRGMMERLAGKIGIRPDHFEMVRKLWFNHTTRTMFITKFAYGLSTPLLITAGLVKLPFNRFWTNTVPLSILQYSVLLTLGYFLGNYYTAVESTFARVQIIVAAVAILAGVYYFFGSAIKRKFMAEQKEREKTGL